MAPRLLLLLLWLQGCVSGPPAESVYSRVQLPEGRTLSVQCSYKGRKTRVEGKVWCKVRKKKCEAAFSRAWVEGPRYLLHDDPQAKVVNITMETLRRQDSGRYWCMRNSSGTLYPMMGFLLEVLPALTTQRTAALTRPAGLGSGAVTAGPEARSTAGTTVVTPGLLAPGGLLPFAASRTARPTSEAGHGFRSTARGTTGPRLEAESPSNARALPDLSTKPGHPGDGGSSTTATCRHQIPALRPQDPHLTVLVVVLSFLPVPVMLVVVYGFWKKKHAGSYSMCRGSAGPWAEASGRPEPPRKAVCSEPT